MISNSDKPKAPTVTVAMPTYNRADLLKASLQSVLEQDYPALQIVVIDNASPDHTKAVVESFDDSRITYLCNSVNVGLFRNWQSAIALTANPYLTILQDDDIMLPGFIQSSVDSLEQYPKAGISVTQVQGINTKGEKIPLPDDPPPTGYLMGLDYLEGMIGGKNWVIHASSVVMRSQTLKAVGKFDNPHSKHSIDLNLYMRLAAQSDLVFIPQVLSHIRIHEGQDTQLRFRATEEKKKQVSKGTGPLAAIAERMDAIAYLLQSPRAQDASYRQWLSQRLLHLSTHRSTLTAEFIPSLNLSWEEQLQVAIQELEALIPTDERFVLADEDQWRFSLPDSLSALPFIDRDGQYDGVPANDSAAIQELTRLRQTGVTHFVVGWPAFWWLDYYAEFHAYLTTTFRCVLNNSRLIVFNLDVFNQKEELK